MKRKYIAMALLIAALTTMMPVTSASASSTDASVIEYVDDDGVDSVNIVEIAKAMHVEVKKLEGGIELQINDKKVLIYDKQGTININSCDISLKSVEMKDPETGKMSNFDIYKQPTKFKDGYLIPKSIIQDKLGITCDSDGIHVDKLIAMENKKSSKNIKKSDEFTKESIIKVTNPSNKNNFTIGRSISGLMYQIHNALQTVNILELANVIGEEVKQTSNGIDVYINGKKVTVNRSNGCAYVENELVYNSATMISGMYLIPKNVVQDKLGILCDWDSLQIKKEADSKGKITVSSIISSKGIDNGYEPCYDYDLADYEYEYADKHGLLTRTEYDINLANQLAAQMESDRRVNINEGWHSKNGKYYYLVKGVPKTGWFKDVTTWYYFNQDGSMYTGWLSDKGKRYYFYNSGAMARKCCVENYYLNETGELANNVPANAPTGISYEELNNRVRSLGFKHKRYYTSEELGGSGGGYSYIWKNDTLFGDSISIGDSGSFNVAINKNDAEANKAIKQIFDWLLPTKSDELKHILSTNPTNETLTMDGRKVTIKLYQGGLGVTIEG